MILQKTADLPYLPKRIISLVPSQTELLYDLGLETETAAITKFCIHPTTWFSEKEKVGGTKTVDLQKIKQIQPDLIIANKEENVKEQIEMLAADYPVWLTDVNNFNDALKMIADIGTLTRKQNESSAIIQNIITGFVDLTKMDPPVKTGYLIWRNPYMTIGGDTFINDMLNLCGLKNISSHKTRYPDISISELQTTNPQGPEGCKLLLLSSEPYPFKNEHIVELQQHLPNTKIMLVNGEMFSWYGSRMLRSASYFKQLTAEIQREIK